MRISDWSSDVCSSDLLALTATQEIVGRHAKIAGKRPGFLMTDPATRFGVESSRPTLRHGKCALDVLRRLQPRQIDVACALGRRSEEHTSELQSLMRISYAVFCLKKKK